MDFLQALETDKIIAQLQALNLHELVNNPYFLGMAGALALLAVVMRWRMLLVTVLTITGFVWLLSYTLAQNTSLEGGAGQDTLLVFVVGGAAIVFVAIYLLFIRGE